MSTTTWAKNDEVVTTYGTIKQAQNEAFRQGIDFAINLLRDFKEQEVADKLEAAIKSAILYEEGA